MIARIGAIVAQSFFREVTKGGYAQQENEMQIAGATPEQVTTVVSALRLLESKRPYAARQVHAFIRRFAFSTARWKWKNFCDGTLLLHPDRETPVDRLAAYLYRVALENILFRRFGMTEVFLNDVRCKLFAYRRELDLMRALGCSSEWIREQERFVQEYRDQHRLSR